VKTRKMCLQSLDVYNYVFQNPVNENDVIYLTPMEVSNNIRNKIQIGDLVELNYVSFSSRGYWAATKILSRGIKCANS